MNREKIFTTTDPQNRSVTLYADTLKHIRKHPEIKGHQEIKRIIQRPDVITENTYRNSICYTKISDLSLYVNVYARTTDINSNTVIRTAFLERKLPIGDVIWQKASIT